MSLNAILSRLTVSTIGLTCKSFLSIGYCSSVTVNGLENLKAALQSSERNAGRGVITVSNHISTLDDPVTWGVLPAHYFFSSRMTRWTLGASDIMFTNPVFSAFFRKGQVLETFRGTGIFQPAIDTAICKLNNGAWVHLFGEGKVNQPGNEATSSKTPLLLRFKWGVGRILMEAHKPPIVVPMWLTGFEKLMPEGRSWPWKYLPRRQVALSVTFGKPIRDESIKAALSGIGPLAANPCTDDSKHGLATQHEQSLGVGPGTQNEVRSLDASEHGWMGDVVARQVKVDAVPEQANELARETARIRSAVTAVLHREVEALGRHVLGLDRKS
ncbi:hypothetical protein EIP86_000077 [Pleurotus ostreatoroseus]|nr:hypothetical protein EIP86_000077 [Pleurotus ostreatoroseus]